MPLLAGALIGEPYLTESADVLRAIAGVGSAIARQFMLVAWSSSRSWLDAKHDTARMFVAAINQASNWANKNKREAEAIFGRYVKLPVAMAQRIHHVGWSTAPPVDLIQPVVDVFAKYGQIPKPFPATELL